MPCAWKKLDTLYSLVVAGIFLDTFLGQVAGVVATVGTHTRRRLPPRPPLVIKQFLPMKGRFGLFHGRATGWSRRQQIADFPLVDFLPHLVLLFGFENVDVGRRRSFLGFLYHYLVHYFLGGGFHGEAAVFGPRSAEVVSQIAVIDGWSLSFCRCWCWYGCVRESESVESVSV